jgi:hypothetical protein
MLLLLLIAPLVHADTIGPDHQLGSAYGYDYGYANGDSTFLYIDGSAGREWFRFGLLGSVGVPVMNAFGLLVSAGDATDDPFLYYAQYGFGGDANGYLGDSEAFSFVPDVPRDDNDLYSIATPDFNGFIRGTVTYKDWSQPTEDSGYTLRTDPWSFAGPMLSPPSMSGLTFSGHQPDPIPEPETWELVASAVLLFSAARFVRYLRFSR